MIVKCYSYMVVIKIELCSMPEYVTSLKRILASIAITAVSQKIILISSE